VGANLSDILNFLQDYDCEEITTQKILKDPSEQMVKPSVRCELMLKRLIPEILAVPQIPNAPNAVQQAQIATCKKLAWEAILETLGTNVQSMIGLMGIANFPNQAQYAMIDKIWTRSNGGNLVSSIMPTHGSASNLNTEDIHNRLEVIEKKLQRNGNEHQKRETNSQNQHQQFGRSSAWLPQRNAQTNYVTRRQFNQTELSNNSRLENQFAQPPHRNSNQIQAGFRPQFNQRNTLPFQRLNGQSQLCRYHQIWGFNARNCEPPCRQSDMAQTHIVNGQRKINPQCNPNRNLQSQGFNQNYRGNINQLNIKGAASPRYN
jgi:hypothetical protein